MPPKLSWVNLLHCHLLHSLQHQSQYKLFTFSKLLKQHPISTSGTLQWFALKSKQVIVPWESANAFHCSLHVLSNTLPLLKHLLTDPLPFLHDWAETRAFLCHHSAWVVSLHFVISCTSQAPLQKLKHLNLYLFPIYEKIECVELKRL